MTANDRGVEVRDLIAHLQTLDPYARIVYSADGYTETPACVKDFTRQASGAVEIRLPTELIKEMEESDKIESLEEDIEDYQEEIDNYKLLLNDAREKINKLESALSSIHRDASEALED